MRSGLSHQDYSLRPEKTVSGRLFTIQRLPSSGKGARFSCSISKKVAPKAVDRNRARRRIRAAFRDVLKPGLYVILVKKAALTAPFRDLSDELRHLSEKIA